MDNSQNSTPNPKNAGGLPPENNIQSSATIANPPAMTDTPATTPAASSTPPAPVNSSAQPVDLVAINKRPKARFVGLFLFLLSMIGLAYLIYSPVGNKSQTTNPVSESVKRSKYAFETVTFATKAQKTAFDTAADSATTIEELQTNMNKVIKDYYSSIDYSKQYTNAHYPDFCITATCLAQTSSEQFKKVDVIVPTTNLAGLKAQSKVVGEAFTSIPIELLHTVTPSQLLLGKSSGLTKPADIDSAINVEAAGTTFGLFSDQRMFFPIADTGATPQADVLTVVHELGHVFRRAQLLTFNTEKGYEHDLLQVEKRPYTKKVTAETTQTFKVGDLPKDGYISPYARTSIGEDTAEMFVFLTLDTAVNKKPPATYASDEVFVAKAKVLANYIHRFVPNYKLN